MQSPSPCGLLKDQEDSKSWKETVKKKNGRGFWTKEEDEKVCQLVQSMQSPSASGLLKDQEDSQSWKETVKKKNGRGFWTKEEDEKVCQLVQLYGAKKWAFIAQHLEGRMGKQCRERWINHLRPNIKKTEFNEEEDRIIREAHEQFGNKWARIAKLLPGRSDNSIKNRWNSKLGKNIQFNDIIIQMSNNGFINAAKMDKHELLLKGTVNKKRKVFESFKEEVREKSFPKKLNETMNDFTPIDLCTSALSSAKQQAQCTRSDTEEALVYYDRNFKPLPPQTVLSKPNQDIDINLKSYALNTNSKEQKLILTNEKSSGSKNSTQSNISFEKPSQILPDTNSLFNPTESTPMKEMLLVPGSICIELSNSSSRDTNNIKTNQDKCLKYNSILKRNVTPLKLEQKIVNTPKTPKILKNIEKITDKCDNVASTPTLLEDIEQFIIEEETCRPYSNDLAEMKGHRTSNCIKKSLAPSWAELNDGSFSFSENTNDGVMPLLQSSPMKDKNVYNEQELNDIYKSICKLMYEKWVLIACGRTNDQMVLTEQAYQSLSGINS